MNEDYIYLVMIVGRLLIIDLIVWMVWSVFIAFYSVKQQWEPERTKRYAFWGLLQFVALLGIFTSLVIPPWYRTAILFGSIAILIMVLSLKFGDSAIASREQVYGKEYWKKPGTRDKSYLFLHKNKIKALNEQNRILESSPTDASAWLRKGELLKELGEGAEADKCFAEAEKLGPDSGRGTL